MLPYGILVDVKQFYSTALRGGRGRDELTRCGGDGDLTQLLSTPLLFLKATVTLGDGGTLARYIDNSSSSVFGTTNPQHAGHANASSTVIGIAHISSTGRTTGSVVTTSETPLGGASDLNGTTIALHECGCFT